MGTEIAKPANLEDVLKDKIRLEIIGLIPEESFKELIKKEWELYFTASSDCYNRNKISPFKSQIKSILNEEIKKRMKDELDLLMGKHDWEGNAEDNLKSIMEEMAPMIMNSFALSLTRHIVEQIKMSIQSSNINCL